MRRTDMEIGMEVAELFVTANLCKSKSEARKLIKNGGIKVQDMKATDPSARVVMDKDIGKIILVEKSEK
jgi:tyrosyl-tRNA synthetase